MNSISIHELNHWKTEDYFLLDVREAFEHEHFNIGGVNIPLGVLHQHLDAIPQNKAIVVYCAKGIRSVIAIQKLESKGYSSLYNLTGGIGYNS